MSIVATVLTTYRPDLLARTIESSKKELLQCDHVIVLHNGGDDPTSRVLDACGIDHDRIVHTSTLPGCIPNGPATSICAAAAHKSGCDYWLHLEEDWVQLPELVAALPDWFLVAQEIASNPAIGQVRLREESHLGQLVHTPDGLQGDGSGSANTNWIDYRPVAWTVVDHAPFMVGPAHFTFNPFIMRTSLIGDGVATKPGISIASVFPAETERHAMARFYAQNLLVAQMRPGIYHHIGDNRRVGQH